MEKFIRRTFSLTKRQIAHLEIKAERIGSSIADAFRRLIDEDIDKNDDSHR